MSMGYSGLIYAVIVAAWAGVLIPRWLRRHEEIDHARETDAARGVRVLQRSSGRTYSSHRRYDMPDDGSVNVDSIATGTVETTATVPPDSHSAVSGSQAAPTIAELDEMFALAAARRRRVLVILLGASALSIYAAFDALSPTWMPAVPLTALVWFLVTARRAVIRQARSRRVAVRMASRVPRQDAVADEPDAPTSDDAMRVAVLEMPEVEQPDPDAWAPVDVPLPTYMSKPAAPRLVRKIDLAQPGSWTSGRLDPTGSIQPPRRTASPARSAHDTERYDDLPEHKRAVGD